MKKISILVTCLILIGCVSIPLTPPNPIISHSTWSSGITKERAYELCLIALHQEGFKFKLRNISKADGLINTQWKKFILSSNGETIIIGKYALQLLIYRLPNNTIVLNVDIRKPHWKSFSHKYYSEEVDIKTSNKVAKEIENLFARLNQLFGETGHCKKDIILTWEH